VILNFYKQSETFNTLYWFLYKLNKRTCFMINVTDKAKEKIVSLRETDGLTDAHNIRVAVKGGGCSGLMYDLLFDSALQVSDEIFEDKGIKILVDKKSLLYLLGTTLDFSDGLNGKGFLFINPNASRSCGCGESFAV